jgi:replication-associated recombination protein RarA
MVRMVPSRHAGWRMKILGMKTFFSPSTKRGYNLFEVASCLQKAIRRADTALAGYMAVELFESGYHQYCWKRLLTISAEDCAGVITTEIKALFDSFNVMNPDPKRKPRSRIFLSKAVIVLCAAIKSRDADHLTNYVYDRRMIDARKLTEAIAESRNSPEPIPLPEYTFDVHTRVGRRRGKTKEDFFRDELGALQPRQIGLFDDLVVPPGNEPPAPQE